VSQPPGDSNLPGRNTHSPMSDLNSAEIADPLSKFLADKKLD
jgi:hypothetical protein